MIIPITLSTIPAVRTCSATVLCETAAYGIFISLAADLSFISPYQEK